MRYDPNGYNGPYLWRQIVFSLSTAPERGTLHGVDSVPVHEEVAGEQVGDDEIENMVKSLPATTTTHELADSMPETEQTTFTSLCETSEKPPTIRDIENYFAPLKRVHEKALEKLLLKENKCKIIARRFWQGFREQQDKMIHELIGEKKT